MCEASSLRSTIKLMEAGASAIYHPWIEANDWAGRPMLLERHKGKSLLGDWYYVPILIRRPHALHKEDKLALTFYAMILEKVQGVLPNEPALVNEDLERLTIHAEEFTSEVNDVMARLARIRDGEAPEIVYRKACLDTSPWGELCERQAKEHNDVALLFNVDLKKLRALREQGITTVERAAELDPEALEGREAGLSHKSLVLIKQQAQALSEPSVIIRRKFETPLAPLEIFFDIESYPQTDTDYLFGFWLRETDTQKAWGISFVAKRLEDEEEMWHGFLAWLSTLPNEYRVYHYAMHEVERMHVLAKRYGDVGHPDLERFLSRMVDLKEPTREDVVFPLYIYSLKHIGHVIGAHWTGSVKGGGASIDVYDHWLKRHQKKDLDALIQYNQEDVIATMKLLDWLRMYATEPEKKYEEPFVWMM